MNPYIFWNKDRFGHRIPRCDRHRLDNELLGFSMAAMVLTIAGISVDETGSDSMFGSVELMVSGPALTKTAGLWLHEPHRLLR